tara:strand:- start:72 stop:272 length:201 start_codon:yes stop_codon:yes gene_type:complete
MSKWISVKKNPPEDMVEVILLLSRDVHPLIASGHRRYKMFNLDRIENGDTYEVTHWMPLPKLPKDI